MDTNEFCAGCLRANEKETAFLWCNDCEEPVCRSCGKVHARFVIPHDIIDIQKDHPKVNKTWPNTCTEHAGNKLIFVCVNHDKIVCLACVSESHKKCDITHIEKAAKGIKERSAILDLEKKIINQKYTIERVKDEYSDLSSKIQQEKEHQHDRLKQIRLKIEDHLNRLEKSIDLDYNEKEENISRNIIKVMCLEQSTDANIHEIQLSKTEAKEVNLFHFVKNLETCVISNEEKTESLKKDIGTIKFQLIPESFIKKIDIMFRTLGNGYKLSSVEPKPINHVVHNNEYSNEMTAVNETQIFQSEDSLRFCACCFIQENKVIVIEDVKDNSIERINLRIIDLEDGESHSFHPRRLYDRSLDKQAICAFASNNVLLLGRNCIYVVNIESEKVADKIELSITMKKVICIENQIWVLCKQWREHDCLILINSSGHCLKTFKLHGNIFDLDIIQKSVFCTFNDVNDITHTPFFGESYTCYTSLDLREKCFIAACGSLIFLLEKDRNYIYTVDLLSEKRSIFQKNKINYPTHMKLNGTRKKLAVICEGGTSLKILNTCINQGTTNH